MKKHHIEPSAHPKHTAARPHRKVHKSFGAIMIVGWILVVLCSAILSFKYISSNKKLTINRENVNLTVTKVIYDKAGTTTFNAPPGWKFVYVDVTVINYDENIFNFAPVLQTFIVDDTGTKYFMSPAILQNPISAGPIKHGETKSGTLSYLVPVKAKDITFQFRL